MDWAQYTSTSTDSITFRLCTLSCGYVASGTLPPPAKGVEYLLIDKFEIGKKSYSLRSNYSSIAEDRSYLAYNSCKI
jgi:hypothetical protein